MLTEYYPNISNIKRITVKINKLVEKRRVNELYMEEIIKKIT